MHARDRFLHCESKHKFEHSFYHAERIREYQRIAKNVASFKAYFASITIESYPSVPNFYNGRLVIISRQGGVFDY